MPLKEVERWIMFKGHIKSFQAGEDIKKKRRKLPEDRSSKLGLAKRRVLCEVGDCFGRETVWPKEEEDEGGEEEEEEE